jgi:hypothetical protein
VGSDSHVSDPTAPVVIVEDSVPSVQDMILLGGHLLKKNREAIFCTSSARGSLLCPSTTRGLILERSANAGAILIGRRGAPFRR